MSVSPPHASDESGLWLVLIVAAYFAVEAALRSLMGGALVIDDGEMMLLARQLQLGYGPQPPLYYWLQHAAFTLVGRNIAALALVKDGLLFLSFLGVYAAGRQVWSRQGAVAAALSLALLPQVIWEYQRGGSHSIGLLAAAAWTLWAWFAVLRRDRLGDWLVFGLMMGIGGMAKPNYWALPVLLVAVSWSLRGALPAITWKRLWLAALVAAVVVAPTLIWAVLHPAASLASVHKFYAATPVRFARLAGFAKFAGSVAAELLLPLLVFLALRWRGLGKAPLQMPASARMLVLSGLLAIAATAVLVLVFAITNFTPRWLEPYLMLIVAGAFAALGERLSPRAFRLIPVTAAVFAIVSAIGMVGVRYLPGQRATVDFAAALPLIRQLAPDQTEASFLIGGNISYLAPDLTVVPSGSTASSATAKTALFLSAPGAPPDPLPDGWQALQTGTIDLPFAGSDKTYDIAWALAGRTQAAPQPTAPQP